jgi:hypothetical protein
MDKPDARHLTIETQEYLRQQAIRLREQGEPALCANVDETVVSQKW